MPFRVISGLTSDDAFGAIVARVTRVIAIRLFPPKPQELPPAHASAWWIPCAVQTMDVLCKFVTRVVFGK